MQDGLPLRGCRFPDTTKPDLFKNLLVVGFRRGVRRTVIQSVSLSIRNNLNESRLAETATVMENLTVRTEGK
jgi:hypothetical protein